MPHHRLIAVAAAVALAALSLASIAYAQTTDNTTVINVTMPYMPNVTLVSGAQAEVGVERQPGQVKVYYTCYYMESPESCPLANYILKANTTTVLYNKTYAVDPNTDCTSTTCSYTITITVDTAYENQTLEFTYTLIYNTTGQEYSRTILLQPPLPGWSQLAPLIPLIAAIGFGLQYSLTGAAIGLIAGVAVDLLLAAAGLAPQQPMIYYLAIFFATALIFVSRK